MRRRAEAAPGVPQKKEEKIGPQRAIILQEEQTRLAKKNNMTAMDDNSFARERNQMVDEQIAARGVRDPRVLSTLRAIPRHIFVPPGFQPRAYEDHPIEIGRGQTISQPYMVALMTELLELKPSDRVLEIGTGSGYQAAILADLAAEVVSIERHPELAEPARLRLAQCAMRNVEIIVGDGTQGYAPCAPYNAIVVTAGAPRMPGALKGQLALGGRLVCPVGPRGCQELIKLTRNPTGFEKATSIRCVFVPLIGEEGWRA